MPPVKSRKSRANVARAAAYPASKPTDNTADKENASPQDSASPAATSPPARKSKSSPKSKSSSKARADLPDSYLDIELEEAVGYFGDVEVPCYENARLNRAAAVIRRKLNALIDKKVQIPGSDKTFNKSNLSKELCKIAQDHDSIESSAHTSAKGPSVRALTTFLKKSGTMGGGDSQTFYYGTMLLEMLRIWNGEKKSAARVKAEDEFPNGRRRIDPATVRLIFSAKNPLTRAEVANLRR